jgi:hypothetical protein
MQFGSRELAGFPEMERPSVRRRCISCAQLECDIPSVVCDRQKWEDLEVITLDFAGQSGKDR